MSGQITVEILALELETYRCCFPAQPALSALQGSTGENALTSCEALPPQFICRLTVHSFSQQLLDLTHRRRAEREDDGIDIGDVHPPAAAVYMYIMFYLAGPSAACSPTGRPAHNCCSTLRRAPAQQQRSIAVHNLDNTGGNHAGISYPGFCQLRAWHSSLPAAPLPVVSTTTAAPAHSLHWFPPLCLLEVLKILLTHTFSSSHSPCTPDPVMWEARHGSSRAPSGSVSKWLESAGSDTASTRFVWHAPPWILRSFSARLLHWWVLFHSEYLRL